MMHQLLFGHQVFLSVFLRLQENNETFRGKNAEQQTIAGGKNRKNLHSDNVLPRRANVSGDEGDPDGTEDQHAEGDQLGLVEVVREFPSEKGQEEAGAGQQADVAQDQREAHHRGHGTPQGDL